MRIAFFIVVGCLTLGLSSQIAHTVDCDIEFLYGRSIDPETKFDSVRNVCVKDGRIAKITGPEIIDAKGRVDDTGANDMHFHSITPHGVKLGLRDGVTTAD
jgi:predicted amidohydrolase